ncbi:MAG: DUF5615 family PIN-like protein [Gemmatales bacterium]
MKQVRYLADEDFRFTIVQAVRRLEPAIEIMTVQELGLSGSTDGEVLDFAHRHEWIIVSHDVNTLKGEAEARVRGDQGVAGVFLVAQLAPTRAIAESLVLIWSASTLDEWKNLIEYLPI